MPREEVPYPCDCNECSTSQKLKTINGIEPNDGGNISILGDEGVTVKSDKNNHIVTFGVDTSTIDNVKHATSADTATNADFATKADSATKADTATKADSADFAARANYSVQASMANYDTKGKTIMNTDGTQDVTGAKTFSGDQTFTGAIGASGAITATGAITASNSANILKVANHNTVLTSNDVLSAKDINEVNGSANNLLHRTGNEVKDGPINFIGIAYPVVRLDFIPSYTTPTATANGFKDVLMITSADNTPIGSLRLVRINGYQWMELVTITTAGGQNFQTLGEKVAIE